MKSLVVFGASGASPLPPAPAERVTVDGVTVRCAVVDLAPGRLDAASPAGERAVRLRVRAVSCNYRDRVFIHQMRGVPRHRFTGIGSEFLAEVLEVGARVEGLRPGDRVIPDHDYAGGEESGDGVREGIPTNRASRGEQVLHERKLLRVPGTMDDATGALFGLGAQTAYGMVRRLGVREGERVLVTAGGSNTSLFALAALRLAGARVFATTGSPGKRARLLALGAEAAVGWGAEAAALSREVGGFDCVVDPFFDLHLAGAVELLRPFGRYATCGMAAQTPQAARDAGIEAPLDAGPILVAAIRRNLTVMGNCLGRREDLERAVEDHAAGRLEPVLDSVFEGARGGAFLARTFNDRARFGKVVYRFD